MAFSNWTFDNFEDTQFCGINSDHSFNFGSPVKYILRINWYLKIQVPFIDSVFFLLHSEVNGLLTSSFLTTITTYKKKVSC